MEALDAEELRAMLPFLTVSYPPPSGVLAQELAPFQTALTPWLYVVVGLTAVAAVLLVWRRHPAWAALCAAAAFLTVSVLCNFNRDRREGWEEDEYARLATLRADELYYYIPDPGRVRLAACGNDNLAADAMYFRSLFFIYQTSNARGSGELIYHMYDVMQSLNPRWKEPQLTGPVLVSALAGGNAAMRDDRIELARKLLLRSQKQFPHDFRFLDLEANLYWTAAASPAEEKNYSRRLVEIYAEILDRFKPYYTLHPEAIPYLEYAPRPVRRAIAAAAAVWWNRRFPHSTLTQAQMDEQLTAADRADLAKYWEGLEHPGDESGGSVATALQFATSIWKKYCRGRTELRANLLMSLDAPDDRQELFTRAVALDRALEADLENPLLDQRERPEKLLQFLRWTDVARRTACELQVAAFLKKYDRLPTQAEFNRLAWEINRRLSPPALPEKPPSPVPPPEDPFGWAYGYAPGADGRSFAVRSRFDEVYQTDLKASRLLTLIDMTAADAGQRPTDLDEVHRFLIKRYPHGQVVPAPILDSFGPERDTVDAPCGGRFELRQGRLYVPADVKLFWKLRGALVKLTFDELLDRIAPYAPPLAPDKAAGSGTPAGSPGAQPPRAPQTGQVLPYS